MEKLLDEMYQAIEEYGLGSQEALDASQRLDILIVKEQSRLFTEHRVYQQKIS